MSSYDPSVSRSLYAVVLSAEGQAPNLPKSDEEEIKKNEEENEKDKKDEKDKKEEVITVKIDFDNIQDRVVSLKLPSRNY
ncbi:hypothetical protein J9332_40570, partial [Aquimarina celericrescens]|nr:hypothetical protein [Aquimarina celericrescens]